MRFSISLIFALTFLISCSDDKSSSESSKIENVRRSVEATTIPNGSIDSLIVDSLLNYSNQTLSWIRNDIYARHGYKFKNKKLDHHYSNKSFYKPEHEDVTEFLSEIEKNNIQTIRIVESLRQEEYGGTTIIKDGHRMHFKDPYFYNHPETATRKILGGYPDTIYNPTLGKVEKSLFTQSNIKNTFCFLVALNRNNIRIADCNSDMLNFALTGIPAYDISVDRPVVNGEGTYSNYEWNLTTVGFQDKFPVVIVADGIVFFTHLGTWGIDSENECPGDRPYMLIDSTGMSEYIDYSDPWEDESFHKKNMNPDFAFGFINLMGIETDWQYEFTVNQKNAEFKSTNGKTLKGVSVDLNEDGIQDLFWYNELPERDFDTQRTTRLYVNIDGQWTLRYIDYFIGCY